MPVENVVLLNGVAVIPGLAYEEMPPKLQEWVRDNCTPLPNADAWKLPMWVKCEECGDMHLKGMPCA